MALIDVDDVQPWLEESKLNLDHNDDLIEEPFQSAFVLSRLSSCSIDVSSWVDTTTVPFLVKQIIGMLVAAQRYNRYYSETDEDAGNPYANKLEERAELLLTGICSGSISIPEITDDPSSSGFGSPSFYPTDLTGLFDPEEAVRFTMGQKF